MNNPSAVIGTNSWGSAAYEKIIRGSVVDNDTLKEAMKVAERHNMTISQVAIFFVANKGIVPICGCRKPHQIEQLKVAADTKLNEVEMKKLEEVEDEFNINVLGSDMFRFAVRK